MTQRFAGIIPTDNHLEKLRLVLSTFQDGTGQHNTKGGKNLPGWRDFERSVALVFDGTAQENKAIFDVLVPIAQTPAINYGISCKMRKTLHDVGRTGRVTIEVSNSAGQFWDALKRNNIDESNIDLKPKEAGSILIQVIEQWYDGVSLAKEGNVDLSKSFQLVLQWDERRTQYQLFQFLVQLPDPLSLSWKVEGRRLSAYDNKGRLMEWYAYSGGQLKYYPFAEQAIWSSKVFELEPIPKSRPENALLSKARNFFPRLWKRTNIEKK